MSKDLKKILWFTFITLILSGGYYLYAATQYPPTPENETFLSEVGEALGEIGLWLLVFIYARTVLKLLLARGPLSKRLIPDYSTPVNPKPFQPLLRWLDSTHIYFGIIAVAFILLHIGLMGVPMHILFFPAVIALVIWQTVFGLFISWRYTPKEIKKLSYLVHAQLFTGIMMGIFSYLGHVLIDD